MTNGQLTGRITRKDTQQGIHGLRVEAFDAQCGADKPLGTALTDRNGNYRIDLRDADGKASCCDCRTLYLRIRDRDCRIIYDGCADRRCCESDDSPRIDIALDPQPLWWHLSRPTSWERIDGPLIPQRVMQEIEDALEQLRAEGLSSQLTSMRLAQCVTPPIEGFDRILIDAWATLQGDHQAAQRYRSILDALCGTQGGCCDGHGPFEKELDAMFSQPCEEPTNDCQEPDPCKDDCGCGCGGCDDACSCGTSLVSNDKLTLLVMAALHVACGNQALARRYVEVLLGQVCRFATLGSLHTVSLQALLGDQAAKAHARDLLELLCQQCPTGDDRGGCSPRKPPSCCEPCLPPKLLDCLREAVKQWCGIHCYRVCEVRPPRACPGDEVLILGCGFGSQPGRVSFRPHAGSSAPAVGNVTSWCDDRIAVTIPQGAGCGMWLELPAITVELCGRYLDLRPLGCIEQGFEGTSAEILRFDIKGHTGGSECPLQPGEPLRIRWNTCAADRVRVEIIDLGNNAVIAAQDPAAANGRWDFTATQFTRTVRMRVRITAFGRCTPPQVSRQIDLVFQRRPSLSVQGLEVTQAIQHYRADQHLTDAADRGPDNSLRLVVNKTAWVRVYLRSGQDPSFDNGQVANIGGTLRVERRVNGIWSTVATLPAQNGTITAEDTFASYDAERGNINTTLNFVVPANIMTGLLRFTANVASPFAPCPGNVASGSTQVDVNLQQTLNAAFITIGYNGRNATNTGNIVLAAPTLATCQAETSWAMTTYPVSGAPNVRVAGTFVTTTPLDDPRSCPGCCSPNWQPLLQQVAALVALDQMSNPGPWVYYGIVAGGIPVNVPGCNGWGATGGLAGAPQTYAHEIGHQFGLPHARCGNAGNGNANYPVYEPYDLPVDPPNTTNWTMASIGEYGLDINNGAIANPNDAEDFMSYCGPRWISRFTYNFLTNIATLTPQVIPSGAPPRVIQDEPLGFERDERAIQPLVHMLGSINADGAIDVASVARIETRYMRGKGRQTRYVAQLVDHDGRVISQDVVYAYESEGCCGKDGDAAMHKDCGCDDCKEGRQPVLFKAMLPDLATGAALRILKCGEVVWERKGPKEPPVIRSVRAVLDKSGDLELTWKLAGRDKERGKDKHHERTEAWVRWTNDDGKTWHALTVGVHDEAITVPAEQLPGGHVRFELLVHDGFHTVRATTEAIELRKRPPSVAILYPTASSRVYADRLIHLWGSAAQFDGTPIASDAAEWFVDGKPVGKGLDLWVENIGPGRHKIELRATADGLTGSATSEIEVIGEAAVIG